MYSPSIFSIAQADPLLIQLSIPYKSFWNNSSTPYLLKPTFASAVELK